MLIASSPWWRSLWVGFANALDNFTKDARQDFAAAAERFDERHVGLRGAQNFGRFQMHHQAEAVIFVHDLVDDMEDAAVLEQRPHVVNADGFGEHFLRHAAELLACNCRAFRPRVCRPWS